MRCGTAIKIQTIINENPDAITIDIIDPSGNKMVDDGIMTVDPDASPLTGYAYFYIYQSADQDEAGKYRILIKATSGSYTAKSEDAFTLESGKVQD